MEITKERLEDIDIEKEFAAMEIVGTQDDDYC